MQGNSSAGNIVFVDRMASNGIADVLLSLDKALFLRCFRL